MSQKNSVFPSGPLQQNGIGGLRESRVERANQIEVGISPGDSAKYAAVEVMVANQP